MTNPHDVLKTAQAALAAAKAQAVPPVPSFMADSIQAELDFDLDNGCYQSATRLVKKWGFRSIKHYQNAVNKYHKDCQKAIDDLFDSGAVDHIIDQITQATITIKQGI